MFKTILLDIEDKIATVTLNRPDAANGIDLCLGEELIEAARQIDANDSVKAVIITGSGRFFCAGGDLKAMLSNDEEPAITVKRLADSLHQALTIFERMTAPVIIAVNGVAAGAGFSMAATGSLAIAADSASFTMAYSRAGLSPDGSSSYYLPRLIGLRKTAELMLTNRSLSAQEALEWGIVNAVVPAENLMEKAREYAAAIINGPAMSHAKIKQLLTGTFNNSLEEQMALESLAISACMASPDGREGVQAFLEKRKPVFE